MIDEVLNFSFKQTDFEGHLISYYKLKQRKYTFF